MQVAQNNPSQGEKSCTCFQMHAFQMASQITDNKQLDVLLWQYLQPSFKYSQYSFKYKGVLIQIPQCAVPFDHRRWPGIFSKEVNVSLIFSSGLKCVMRLVVFSAGDLLIYTSSFVFNTYNKEHQIDLMQTIPLVFFYKDIFIREYL